MLLYSACTLNTILVEKEEENCLNPWNKEGEEENQIIKGKTFIFSCKNFMIEKYILL